MADKKYERTITITPEMRVAGMHARTLIIDVTQIVEEALEEERLALEEAVGLLRWARATETDIVRLAEMATVEHNDRERERNTEKARADQAEADIAVILEAMQFPDGAGPDGEYEVPEEWAARLVEDVGRLTDIDVERRLAEDEAKLLGPAAGLVGTFLSPQQTMFMVRTAVLPKLQLAEAEAAILRESLEFMLGAHPPVVIQRAVEALDSTTSGAELLEERDRLRTELAAQVVATNDLNAALVKSLAEAAELRDAALIERDRCIRRRDSATDDQAALSWAHALGIVARILDANTSGAAFLAEKVALEERVEQYEEDFRKVLADDCAPDEKHCSCVPHLRARIAEVEEEIAAFETWADAAEERMAFLLTQRNQLRADLQEHEDELGEHHAAMEQVEKALGLESPSSLDTTLAKLGGLVNAAQEFLSEDMGAVIVHPGTDEDNVRLDVPLITWEVLCVCTPEPSTDVDQESVAASTAAPVESEPADEAGDQSGASLSIGEGSLCSTCADVSLHNVDGCRLGTDRTFCLDYVRASNLDEEGSDPCKPPHPLEFAENDTDLGRACMRCGFPVPASYRYAHNKWCDRLFVVGEESESGE